MKIVHISDLHIRNLERHDEYKRAFEDLYKHIDVIKPDLVVNTGDTAHNKINISPEFVSVLSSHITEVSKRCDYLITLGNHDLSLTNLNRKDAISPVVECLNLPNVHLLTKSQRFSYLKDDNSFNFWVFGCADEENFPNKKNWLGNKIIKGQIDIGLFHGSIFGAQTDLGWKMSSERNIDLFEGLDYVFMGDIHKQQFFNNKRFAYAGSLIQQDFSEDVNKGFLLWEIESKEKFKVTPVYLNGSRKFISVVPDQLLKLPKDAQIDPESRLRILPQYRTTLIEQRNLEHSARELYKVKDVVTVQPKTKTNSSSELKEKDSKTEDLNELPIQENLLKEFFKNDNLSNQRLNRIFEINKEIQSNIKQEFLKNVSYEINNIEFDNFFQYGEKNFIDFISLQGIIGLFSKNASGKSNLIETLNISLFNENSLVENSYSIVNDNKKKASCKINFSLDNEQHIIERSIERKVKSDGKQESKRTCNFYHLDKGKEISKNKISTTDTNKFICSDFVGTFDNFQQTSYVSQNKTMDLVWEKTTERKKILYKYLGLEIFEKKCEIAKDYLKAAKDRLKNYNLEELLIHQSVTKTSIKNENAKINLYKEILKQKDVEKMLLETEISLMVNKRENVIDDKFDIENALKEVEKISIELSNLYEKVLKQIDFSESDYKLLKDKVNSFENEIQKLKNTISEGNKKTEILKTVPCGDSFPTCRFLKDAFEIKSKLSEYIQLLKGKEEILNQLKVILEENKKLEENFRKNNENKLKIENFELKQKNILDKIEESKRKLHLIENNKKIDELLKPLNDKKIAYIKEIAVKNNEILECTKNVGIYEGLLIKTEEQIEKVKQLNEEYNCLDFYVRAMGVRGLANQILNKKLPIINEEINKILDVGANFGVEIEYDENNQSVNLNFNSKDGQTRLLELASGAQKMIASLAIRVGLLNVSNLPKSNLFIIDEGFGKLDEQNLEEIKKMLRVISYNFDHLLIVSHLGSMKEIADHIIEISTDKDGYAHVEVN